MKHKLDEVDFTILSLLAENAQMAYTEVAKRATISRGTVHMRMKKMRDLGIVNGATLDLDYMKIGWEMTIFLGLFLRESSLFKKVIKQLEKVPEVVKIHHTTGKYDVFVKMHAKDSIHYRNVYQEHILTIKGIREVESFISVEQNLNRHIEFGS